MGNLLRFPPFPFVQRRPHVGQFNVHHPPPMHSIWQYAQLELPPLHSLDLAGIALRSCLLAIGGQSDRPISPMSDRRHCPPLSLIAAPSRAPRAYHNSSGLQWRTPYSMSTNCQQKYWPTSHNISSASDAPYNGTHFNVLETHSHQNPTEVHYMVVPVGLWLVTHTVQCPGQFDH